MNKLIILLLPLLALACNEPKMTEEEAWLRIGKFRSSEQTDSLGDALNYYLDHFSDGKYASEVESLKQAFDTEAEEWARVSGRRCTLKGVDEFLFNYPSGFFRQQALDAIDSLNFREALTKNTVEAFENYLNNFPNGNYARKARAMIDGTEERSVTPEERRAAISTIERHFSYMTENDEDIANTVADNISCYIGKDNCTMEDVIDYMVHVCDTYDTKVMETSGFDVRKIMAAGSPVYNVQFNLKETINPDDTVNCQVRTFSGTAILNRYAKITSLILE